LLSDLRPTLADVRAERNRVVAIDADSAGDGSFAWVSSETQPSACRWGAVTAFES